MKRVVATDIITSLLIFLFAYTAIAKFIHHDSFEAVLQNVPLIAKGAGVLSLLVPPGELGIALLLIFSQTRRMGLYAALVLLSLFTVYLVYMVLFAVHLPCSCGGGISKMSWQQHVMFNAVFIGLTVAGILNFKDNKSLIAEYGNYKVMVHIPAPAVATVEQAGCKSPEPGNKQGCFIHFKF